MIAEVVKDDCIGCGVCNSICPEVFEMDDDGLAVALEGDFPPDLEDAVRDAADSCPTDTIKIR